MTPTSTRSRSFPTLRHLGAPFRWLFRSRRRAWTAAAVLLGMLVAPCLWWPIQLLGLPDIGEPFDEETFRSERIPDDRNAMVLYREAAVRLRRRVPEPGSGDDRGDPNARWSKAAPNIRRWVEENREAMELFRRGADRPDAMNVYGHGVPGFGELYQLALLEASRLEDEGDMAGAWDWYRAAIRATYHHGRDGSMPARRAAIRFRGDIGKRLASWAADPRTTPAMLREALDDTLACESLMPSESQALRADYLFLKHDIEAQKNAGRGMLAFRMWNIVPGLTRSLLDTGWIPSIADAWRFWRREPERSRRVLRLVFANWLAYYDLPPDRRPAPDPDVTGAFDFYALGPEAPAGARALSPRALDRWLSTTTDAQMLLRDRDPRTVRIGERAGFRELVVQLASQLYRRDHGRGPDSEQELVGPYLKALPDDGLGDPGDAKAGGVPTRGGGEP